MGRPLILVSNDDGIDAPFLRRLVAVLARDAEVHVAAPGGERSWIGKAMSRHGDIVVEKAAGFPCPAWRVEGTPADCVNLAIGHLLPRKPDLVLSGINVGFNAGLPLILSSGTVAAALEGALQGYPAAAFSLALPPEIFNRLKSDPQAMNAETEQTLQASCETAAEFAAGLAGNENRETEVHNINFPFPYSRTHGLERTRPGRLNLGSLYRSTSSDNFRFHFHLPPETPQEALTDLTCLRSGRASHSVLRFGSLGQ